MVGADAGGVPPGLGVEVVVVGLLGFVPGAGEVLGGIVPGVCTHVPLPCGTGVAWFGGTLPGAGEAGVEGVGGGVWVVVSVPSPAALVVIGVGGPIGLVGGIIVGFAGAGAALGAGTGAVGMVVFGAVVGAGAVGVVGAGGGAGGVAARVRCAAAQSAEQRRTISGIRRFVMVISLLKTQSQAVRTGR